MSKILPHIYNNGVETKIREGGLWLINNRNKVKSIHIHSHAPYPEETLQPECLMVATLADGEGHYLASCNDRKYVVFWAQSLIGEENVFDLKY